MPSETTQDLRKISINNANSHEINVKNITMVVIVSYI